MGAVRYTWDTTKAAANKRKHGIDFRTAMMVFTDPNRIVDFDDAHSQTEGRWRTIGCASEEVLFVVFTERDADIIRIITARKATRHERRKYYDLLYGP